MPSIPKSSPRRPWQPAPPKREYQAPVERTHLYDSTAWRKLRLLILKGEPLCRSCKAQGKVVGAQMVDHIQPVRSDGDFFESTNLQPLCNPCHARKSAKEGHMRRRQNRDSS